jgi:hypothetical protein
MKKPLLFLLLLPFFSFISKKEEKTIRLTGYVLTYSFHPHHDCPCGLDIASTEWLSSNTFANEICICDGNYYKNFGLLRYVKTDDLDPAKIDNVKYYSQLGQDKKEHLAFLSTNKKILNDVYKNDSTLMKDTSIIRQVESDSILAELIYKAIDGAKIDFSKKKSGRKVLLKVDVAAIRMKNNPESKSGWGKEQYLLLNDPLNKVEFVKVIEDTF